MRVLVCGSRDFNDACFVNNTLDGIHTSTPIELLVHGATDYDLLVGPQLRKGAGQLAGDWASAHRVPVMRWRLDSPVVDPILLKNVLLRYYKPNLVIAFPGGVETARMARAARSADIRVLTAVQF